MVTLSILKRPSLLVPEKKTAVILQKNKTKCVFFRNETDDIKHQT
jgi:hypothetical protein